MGAKPPITDALAITKVWSLGYEAGPEIYPRL
jgi:hypothetical protein